MAVEKGNKVKIEYTGSLEDGTVFDSSEKHGKPLEFEAGTGKVIKGFDDAVMGMEKDEEKKVTIPAEDAYGERKEDLLKDIPRDKLPKEELKEGMTLIMTLPNGAQMPAIIHKIEENNVVLDLNHPLAGKTLHFKLKVVDIEGSDEKPSENPETKKE